MITPATFSSTDLYSFRNDPTALADAPMATNTAENPRMNTSAFIVTARVAPVSPSFSFSTLTPLISEM